MKNLKKLSLFATFFLLTVGCGPKLESMPAPLSEPSTLLSLAPQNVESYEYEGPTADEPETDKTFEATTTLPTTFSPTLPSLPQYTGLTYYVSPSGSGISTSSSRPGSAKTTMEGVADGSTIIFLSGNYGSVIVAKPKERGNIKLKSQVSALSTIDTRKRTSASYSSIANLIVKNPRTDGAYFSGVLSLSNFASPWIEGFYFPQGNQGIVIAYTSNAWVVRNRIFNSSTITGILINKIMGSGYAVCLENWVWNTRRATTDWQMDYGIRVYGTKTTNMYIAKNLILGGFNQPLSTKNNFFKTYIEANYFVAGDDRTTTNPGVAKNMIIGQEADRGGEDRTGEFVYIRENTIRSDAWGIIVANVSVVEIERNNFLDTGGVVEQMFSTGRCIDICEPTSQSGVVVKSTLFKDNWINNSSQIHISPRGDRPETFIVQGNKTASGKPNRIVMHRTPVGDPDDPPTRTTVLPTVNRVGGDASGFLAPIYQD